MPRRPRAVQPWSSPAVARAAVRDALGADVAEGLLSSVWCEVSSFMTSIEANRRRQELGHLEDAARHLEEANRLTQGQHKGLVDALRSAVAERSKANDDELHASMGHGASIDDEARPLAAALGALRWFERVQSEGYTPRAKLTGGLLYLCAVALGIEPPAADSSNSIKGAVSKAQKAWKRRLGLAAASGRSRLRGATWGGVDKSGDVDFNWNHYTQLERNQVEADLASLRRQGRPMEALARRRFLGGPD